MLETIYVAIIAALPALSAIFGIIAAVIKLIKSNDTVGSKVSTSLENLATEIHDTKEMDEMKAAMIALAQSNKALQKRCDELLTEITKIKHGEV